MPSPKASPSENGDNEGSCRGSDVEDFEVEDKRPRCNKLRESLKAAENTQQRKDRLLAGPRRSTATAKDLAKRRKLGKKALQAAREMSHLLDVYALPPSNTVLLNS